MTIQDAEIKFARVTETGINPLVEMIRKYYEFDRIPFDEARIRVGLAGFLKDESVGRAWWILRERQPIGYVILTFGFDLEFDGRQATITDLYLEPEHRRHGFGRKTLAYVEHFCRASGIQALELQVERSNVAAQALYESFGFQAHDRIPMSKRIM